MNGEPADAKVLAREVQRLEVSIQSALAEQLQPIVFLHYPPIYANFRCGEIIDLMKRYGVSRCIYGHLHSDSLRWAVTGMQEGIDFTLVSGDYVDFTPVLLKK